MLCNYGCGQPAKYQMTSGKWCCNDHYSKCPKNKEKNSNNNKGKLPPRFVEIENNLGINCEYGCGQPAKYFIGKNLKPCCSKYGVNCKSVLEKAMKNHHKKGYKTGKDCKLFGKIRPDQSDFMKKNNPMFDENIKNKVILFTSTKEYKKQMSKTIRKIHKDHPEIGAKKSKKSKEMWKNPEFRKKIFESWERIGLRTPDDKLTEKELYYRMVELYTKESLRNFYDKINPENKKIGRNKNDYSIDHKYSKIMGFKNNIDPKIIGSYINLEVLLFVNNCKKKRKCSIKKEELIRLYENII